MTNSGDETRGPLASKDIRAVLAGFGVCSARRAVRLDPTEETIPLSPSDFARIDPREVAIAVMSVLPHTKVWVIEEHPKWVAENF